jgi:hypothetical protein
MAPSLTLDEAISAELVRVFRRERDEARAEVEKAKRCLPTDDFPVENSWIGSVQNYIVHLERERDEARAELAERCQACIDHDAIAQADRAAMLQAREALEVAACMPGYGPDAASMSCGECPRCQALAALDARLQEEASK